MSNFTDLSTNGVQSDTNQKLDSLLEPYFSEHYRERCYPGLIFQQGKRRMVQINVPASDFSGLLQAKPATANDPDSGKNRPEVKGHANEIKTYIIERVRKSKPWIVGTLTANVSPEKITIIELGRGICLVVIKRGVKLDITDGQHRKTAIHELIESQEGELISNDDFPITLVIEGDFHQCQADFKDMAQTRQLDKSLLLSFGEFEGQVGITKILQDKVAMFYGKTEKIKASPSTKNKLIYTTNYIARFVSCVLAGNPSDDLQNYDVEETSEALTICLNQFFSECNSTQYIANTINEQLTIDNVVEFKEDCLLGVSVGLEVLGRLLYYTYSQNSNYFNQDQIFQLAQINWSRDNLLWRDNLIRLDPKPRNPNKPYKLSTSANAVADAVKMVKEKLGWMSVY